VDSAAPSEPPAAYRLDAEVADALARFLQTAADAPAQRRGDWRALREKVTADLVFLADLHPHPGPDVEIAEYSTRSDDGAVLALRWYARRRARPGSAVVYVHGGGMLAGSLDHYDSLLAQYVSATGVPFLSVGYRLAPEATGSAACEDVYSAITWLIEHAAELDVKPDRVAVMGDSAGGGIAAGAAILSRERRLPLARQILIYPMLDDRTPSPADPRASLLTWTHDMNATGWGARLGAEMALAGVSPVIAPARLSDHGGLAPAYLEVGDLDLFRDEDIAYALQLGKAGVPIELHVHPGAPHGFDRFAPQSRLTQRAIEDRLRILRSV